MSLNCPREFFPNTAQTRGHFESFMDGSRVAQSLDSLWFYTNILTCRDEPEASLVESAPLIQAKECPKRDLQKPITPLQHESQNVENLSPRCHKFEEVMKTMVPSRETKKRETRKRRKWHKLGLYETNVVHGGLDLRFDFDVFDVESWEYQIQMLNIQRQTKMPPFDNDVAMKQHLKSWAYAVACTVR
ncbi:hypothetical protein D0Y65_012453 [Glycine soja]|nr:hypothetical protein JHK87_013032 [Glycine soja]RZC12701.1 hypothetical protein D0Y65_012453 [Glycine soja]